MGDAIPMLIRIGSVVIADRKRLPQQAQHAFGQYVSHRRPWRSRRGSRTHHRPSAGRVVAIGELGECARPTSVRRWSPAEWPRLS